MAYDDAVLKGSTSKMLEVMIRDSTTGQGKTGVASGSVAARYMREGAGANVAITVTTMTLGMWVSGGWVEVDAANQPGLYQFGVPNAALATGTDAVTIGFKIPGAIDKELRCLLIDANLRDGSGLGLSRLDAAVSSRASQTSLDTAATNAATAATQATNAASDALLARKLLKARMVVNTSGSPWTVSLVEEGTGTVGASYLDGTILKTWSLYDVNGTGITTASTPVGREV